MKQKPKVAPMTPEQIFIKGYNALVDQTKRRLKPVARMVERDDGTWSLKLGQDLVAVIPPAPPTVPLPPEKEKPK